MPFHVVMRIGSTCGRIVWREPTGTTVGVALKRSPWVTVESRWRQPRFDGSEALGTSLGHWRRNAISVAWNRVGVRARSQSSRATPVGAIIGHTGAVVNRRTAIRLAGCSVKKNVYRAAGQIKTVRFGMPTTRPIGSRRPFRHPSYPRLVYVKAAE